MFTYQDADVLISIMFKVFNFYGYALQKQKEILNKTIEYINTYLESLED